jgi:4-hydroxyphenylacetate 3-monooxygenase
MAIRTGKQFLEGLRDGREIYLEGERVTDVTTHPHVARMAQTLAKVYDLQHDPKYADEMTFTSPSSGELVALSYMIPQDHADLARRRRALEIVADEVHGMLGRTPDYVNVQVTAARQMAAAFGENDPRLGENLIKYHEYIRENDLCLTHAFGHPQVNRGVALTKQPDPYVVQSYWQPLLHSPTSCSVPPYLPARPDENIFCLGFSIPVATPGLKMICRPSFDSGKPLYDAPLSGQYDELDALVVFDDVLVPWDRVFSYDDVDLHNKLVMEVAMWRQYMQQVMVRCVSKLEFIVGIGKELTEAIGIGGFPHIQEKMAELIDTTETIRAFLRAAEADATTGPGEGIWLAPEPCIAMRHSWPEMYARVAAILQQMAAGGLMLTPTEADMTGEIKPFTDKYFQGAKIPAYNKVRRFRIVWDLIGTEFASRSTLYERYFNGDVVRLRQLRFAQYDYTKASGSFNAFIADLEAQS